MTMKITRERPDTNAGPADWFTGSVFVDPISAPPAPSHVRFNSVHFTPGARTHWHTHPLGQTIHVIEGVGRAQREDGPVETITAGTTVYFGPGENHWHGAAPTRLMTHVAMQLADESGSPVTWGEHVSDEQYANAPEITGSSA
jgi:quercetin dioxygenase-like cupin family protein